MGLDQVFGFVISMKDYFDHKFLETCLYLQFPTLL